MTATAAPRNRCGSATIFYHKAEHFSIKEIHLHGPNFISFQLVTGRRRWHKVGCYISPRYASTIEDVSEASMDRPYGAELLVAPDLNGNLVEPEGTSRAEAITHKIAAAGMMDMGFNFLPWCKPWLNDRCTWIIQ